MCVCHDSLPTPVVGCREEYRVGGCHDSLMTPAIGCREEYAQKEQERWEEEERKKMEVQVEIRFHWTHRVDKGVLQTEDEPIQLTCQRLSTLGDLFTTIATVSYGTPSLCCM